MPEATLAPYPLGPIQQAYLVGDQDGLDLRGPARYYLACDLDTDRVDGVRGRLDRLVRDNPVLRLRVGDDLAPTPVADDAVVPVRLLEATEETFAAVDGGVRDRYRSDRFAFDAWPQVEVTVVRTPRRARLHVAYALWLMDAASLADFLQALAGGGAPGPRPAPAGVSAPGTTGRRARDERYWSRVAPHLPEAAEVPLRPDWRQSGRAVGHRMLHIDGASAAALADRARRHGLTLPMVFLTVYGALLGAVGGDAPHTVTLVRSRREDVGAGRELGNYGTTVPLAVPARAGRAFVELARDVQGRFLEQSLHASLSGLDITRLAGPGAPRSGLRHPFAFTAVELDSRGEAAAGLRRVWDSVHLRVPQVLLDHQVGVDTDGSVRLGFDWRTDAFDEGFVEDLIDAYAGTVERLAADGASWVRPAEPAGPVPAATAPPARPSGPGAGTLGQRFLAAAGRTPDAPAVRDDAGVLTYAGLADAAADVAERLVDAGAGVGDLVAVHLPRGRGLVVAVLGALLAGCVFVPLDHGLPPGRLDRIARRAGLRHVVTGEGEDAAAWRGRGVCPVAPGPVARRRRPLPDRGFPETAYVIHTSGSTGEPKGVVVRHSAVLATLDAVNDLIGLTPADSVLAVSSIGFDLSVYDLFGPLLVGAAVVLLTQDNARTPAAWSRAVKDHGVTVWNSTPALASLLQEEGGRLPSLRVFLLSGDWIPLALPEALGAVSADADVISLGGATEGAIWSIHHRVTAADASGRSIPYGKPLAGQDVLVLDARGRVCPDWHIGELHLAGAGVADGYLNDPDRTAEAFALHPEHGWVYRTGDRGRRGPDGVVEFLGRADSQVKVSGHRVELGEIEARLDALDVVRSSAARVTADGGGIVAYAVLSPGAPDAWRERCLAALRDELPSYMVPSALVALDEIPLTANGKVDRRVLAAVPAARAAQAPPEPGGGLHLREAASCWAEVLGRPPGPEGFFASGGSSVDAIRLLSLLHSRYGYEIPFGRFLARPTLAGLAALCGTARGGGGAAGPAVWCFAPRAVARPRGRVVLFPPVGGGVACYAELIRSLPGDVDVRVLGFDRPLDPEPGGAASLAGAADACLRHLPAEVADAAVPCVFAGWSFAGALAAAAARAAPYRVALVVAVDTPESAAARRGDASDAALLAEFEGDVRQAGGVAVPAVEVRRDPALRRRFAVYRQNTLLLRAWRPRPVPVPVVACHAAHRPAEPRPDAGRRWSPEVRDVALTGGHFDALAAANVPRVRDAIERGFR
ncbi:hypothetical protein GCM10018785_04500 [Streptomyces longispororuber]|uniref:Uncharacterized protein n=1 Tax=Streptomyces longispororuber TaxID=68230 RepID=A0A919DD62_9ACTN|nr:non-ribosomal peptide synthetase [Streptomyces longispororuber]GHE38003.1 hypothetical protein GCM10018785_04500 [Streptomyces longispororuber]